MKIYKVELAVNDHKSLLPVDKNIYKLKLLTLDGSSKSRVWPTSVLAEIDNETGITPDAYSFGAGNILISNSCFNKIGSEFSNVEFLPVEWADEKGYLLNIQGFSDCLDENNTEWFIDDDSKKKLFINKHSFIKSKVPTDLLFKIEQQKLGIFCCDFEDNTDNFMTLIQKNKIAGLKFKLIYQT